jgi:hypothetical protein
LSRGAVLALRRENRRGDCCNGEKKDRQDENFPGRNRFGHEGTPDGGLNRTPVIVTTARPSIYLFDIFHDFILVNAGLIEGIDEKDMVPMKGVGRLFSI